MSDSQDRRSCRERPLGPFSNVICWVKGHVWEDDGFLTKGYKCQRCWRMQRSKDDARRWSR